MDSILLKKFIPSNDVRELVALESYRFSDSDVAALIWHSDMPLNQKIDELCKIKDETQDKELARQISERIEYDTLCLERFRTPTASPDEPIAVYNYNACGEIIDYWSDEPELDELVRKVHSLNNKRFENKYVAIPNPFDAGDVVRNVITGDKMVVATSQANWKQYVEKALSPGAIEDWVDASITVTYENSDEHDHINPIYLEKV